MINKLRGQITLASILAFTAVIALISAIFLSHSQKAQPAYAQTISFDSASNTTSGGTTTCSWQHAIGSGTDRLLVVGISIYPGSATATSVTYNGIPLEFVGSASGSSRSEVWGLVNPSSATGTVNVQLSAAKHAVCGASSWSGVSQEFTYGAFAKASGNGTPLTINIPSSPDEIVIDVAAAGGTSGIISIFPDPAQSQIYKQNSSIYVTGASSSQNGSTSTTMTWSITPPYNLPWSLAAISIRSSNFVPSPTPTPSPTPSPSPTPEPFTPPIHIGDLDGRAKVVFGSYWRGQLTIAVHDANHNLVSEATVTTQWNAGSSSGFAASCQTNYTGTCTTLSGYITSPSVTFNVFNLGGATYNPSANHDPDGDSNGTTITVVR